MQKFVWYKIFLTRFSTIECKRSIVNWLEQVGKVYKKSYKALVFITALVSLDIPDLLQAEPQKDDGPSAEQMFLRLVHNFILQNSLHDTVIDQIPYILVSASHRITWDVWDHSRSIKELK